MLRIFVFPRMNGTSGTYSERAHFARRDNRRKIESAVRIIRLMFSAAV